MAIHFYYAPMSSATRVHWALEELGVPYEKHKIDLAKGEQKAPDFLAINPNGKVPALVDGDAKMFESSAMFLWLGEKYGVEKGMWPKAGTPERAEAYAWTMWCTAELGPALVEYIRHTGDRGWCYPKGAQSKVAADDARGRWDTMMGILEKRLEGREYLVGKSFSLVDCAVAAAVGFATMAGGLSVASCPRVGAWVGRCQGRPAMARVMAG